MHPPKNAPTRALSLSATTALYCWLLACMAGAFTTNTPPLGGMNITVAAGTATVPSVVAFALPLLDTPGPTGARVGRILAVSATTLTVAGANWNVGELARVQYPYAIRITSGAAAGYTFTITGNSSDTLSLSGGDLTKLGIATGALGDSFRLIPVDTLNTLFGPSTLTGGPNAVQADVVTLGSNNELSYYYNTTLGRWVRTTGPTADRGNTPIPCNAAITITHKSAGFSVQFTGAVPTDRYVLPVNNAGLTYTHTGYPTAVTLGTLALQSALPGWVAAASAAAADQLAVSDGAGGWNSYFFNGSNWQRTTGPAANRDGIIIAAGTPLRLFKTGAAAGTSTFARNVPYPL